MLHYYGPWVKQALCRDHDDAHPDVWFEDPVRARAICRTCPVRDECLITALELVQDGVNVRGIWGGLSAVQLRRALERPDSIPTMRGQRSRAKESPSFLVPVLPASLLQGREAI